MDMSVQEIISAICGTNADNSSKTMTGCYLYSYNFETENVREKNSCITYMPIVDIFPNGDKVQVDIKFSSDADTDLYKMCQMIEKSRELERDNDANKYYVVFNFLPINLGETDAVSIEAAMPLIHCLTALTPKGQVSTLRLLFEAENVQFYCADEINTSVMDVEINYQVSRRDRANEDYERRKRQNLESINRLEELKRNQRR